jgi:transcriptional regulator with XRE-family HTH domain
VDTNTIRNEIAQAPYYVPLLLQRVKRHQPLGMDWEGWSNRLRAHMRRMKISQEKVAEHLGMTQGGVAHWLNGRREINLSDFFRLCSAAAADPREILFADKNAGAVLRDLRQLLEENPGLSDLVARPVDGGSAPARPPSPETGTQKRIAHRAVRRRKVKD